MPKKTITKKKTTKAVAVRKPNRELIFTGAKSLFGTPADQKEARERKLIMMTAEVFGVSPLAIDILGNRPYINKLGRKQKMKEYDKNAKIDLKWIQRSRTDADKAICTAILLKGGKQVPPFITGECSPASTKMTTLNGYQNHIAETRAINRLIEYHYGLKIHEDMMVSIAKKIKQGADAEIIEKAAQANQTTVEEINEGSKRKESRSAPVVLEKPTDKSDPVRMAAAYIKEVKDERTLITCAKKIKDSSEFTEPNKVFLQKLIDTQSKKIKEKK